MKYLEHNGKGCFLKLYLDISKLKGGNYDDHDVKMFLEKVRSCRSSKPQSFQGSEQELYDTVTGILSTQSPTLDEIKKVEEFCHFRLFEELQDFIKSEEFSKPESSCDSSYGEINKGLNSKYKNVLIIDDSPQNSLIMSYKLKARGHHVRQANHGWIGSHIATMDHFNVVLIDLAMNTMDPLEVIKNVKSTDSNSKSTLLVGLNYSEYDSVIKSEDIMYRINVGKLYTGFKTVESSRTQRRRIWDSRMPKLKFVADFNALIIQHESTLNNCCNNNSYNNS